MSFDDYTVEENILRHLTRLDQIQIEYEARWGVAKLPTLISPELREKWEGQLQKVFKAKEENRLQDLMALVDGCARAYKIMEDEAMSRGHKPYECEMWDIKHPDTGQVYRIVKNNYDAGIAPKDNALVYTREEVARILESKSLMNHVKNVFPDSTVVKVFKTEKEDESFFNDNIPF